MAQNEKTSARVSAIAAKALQNLQALSAKEIKTLAASVLPEADDRQVGQPSFHQKPRENPQNQQKRP